MFMRFLVFAAASLALATDSPRRPANKTDLDALQGTWSLVSAQLDGKALPADKVKQTTIVFKDDTFRFPGLAENATSKAGTIRIDATKTPKQMDATSTEGVVMLGIYTLDGDDCKVCFAPAGKPRPGEFTSTRGSGHILQVWKRTKNP